ncbi:MAG: glycosyltransferase family 4 protein [Aurantimonas endophytica]|uniref:Glycosyltransferase involved in cell wall biosynthesis n=1 Tax=Aurantimonas endophytica TaxID=1522175 RepID=A0A7W6HEE8_9HYPH|nr:glycosyltransferase family 4 protein [Aurantimonas endophytica]MBB4003696.1 glycosyltransferase involved in cell wall biosynthesis [Aurantimonas endophytica]MCO6404552.1 glycosyltransferase [Aurantimonas endophytica]
MRVAFYAPMKALDDPTPSGDRTVGRMLVAALRKAGHEVVIPTRLRSYDRGDQARQRRLRGLGRRVADRLVARHAGQARPFDLWFTYHLYHKAPDWIGPRVAAHLGIPYVVAEASVAGKQRGGRWNTGYEASLAALARAELVIGLNPADRPGVAAHLKPQAGYLDLPPFVDARPFVAATGARAATRAMLAARHGLAPALPWLITVAMMRDDQKLASYRVLAAALAGIEAPGFQLLVIGAGSAEAAVRAAFAPLGSRVVFHGAAEPAELPELYAAADLYVWPAIKESWSMAFIEAQAAGLPVVAGRSGGVAGVVADGVTGFLAAEGDVAGFADGVRRLLDPATRSAMGQTAREWALAHHDMDVAAARLDAALCAVAADCGGRLQAVAG